MKLATRRNGARDGQLLVVSHDLARAVAADAIVPTLQAALDDWDRCAGPLAALAARLEAGGVPGEFAFDPREAMAPLPRAYHWVDGSAYVTHVERVRRARGADMPSSFWTDPLVYQGGSDDLLGACDDARFASEEHGIDFEAEVAVVTGDVPLGTTPEAARGAIRLVMLANDWSLRNLIPAELAKGFGFYQSKPATAFSPVAATPDELGAAWDGGRLHGALLSHVNGAPFGRPDAGADMTFDFPQLIAHITRTRNARAGTLLGSGTVANRDRALGSSCIAERRALEQIEHGAPRTPFLRFGDRVRIEMLDGAGRSIFGAIDQQVAPAVSPR
jgi:fumarylacetoacetate (FAA) hydrolase